MKKNFDRCTVGKLVRSIAAEILEEMKEETE